jgi:hypothetical protein
MHRIVAMQSEKTAGYNKNLQNRTKITGNSRELNYSDSRWGISWRFYVSQKRFLNIKI